ncbi:hypothetical protein [Streptomyces pluripotens]|uniref:hypothetical protein n=1 Tax=Streptomyces pluripotens TaxID=1355015 RepID=UPI001F2BF647|nr:hypothetical protein [Streptomyces pluripotens]
MPGTPGTVAAIRWTSSTTASRSPLSWPRHPDDEELQVAGLVHDIGHRLQPGDEAAHGEHAAAAVATLLGQRVAHRVTLHIPAKRYLAAPDPDLTLSPESTRTLACHGRAMYRGKRPPSKPTLTSPRRWPAAAPMMRARSSVCAYRDWTAGGPW